MAWMQCEGDTGREVWRDRTQARPGIDARTVRRNGVWVTLPPRRQAMTDWRKGSSYVTTTD